MSCCTYQIDEEMDNFEWVTIETNDSIKLKVKRYVNDKPSKNIPLLLIHGLANTCGVWEIEGKNSLVAYLVNEGYDCWLLNLRGVENGGSKFSFSDYYMHDAPATIDHILSATGVSELHILGHSMGAAITFAMLAGQHATKISSFIALAGGCHYEHSAWRFLMPLLPVFKLTGIVPMRTLTSMGSYNATMFGGSARFAAYGPSGNISRALLSHLMATCFTSFPTTLADELKTMRASDGLCGSFGQVDGERKYIETETEQPKSKKVTWVDAMANRPVSIPIFAILGDEDMQCKKQDVEKTLKATGSPNTRLQMVGKSAGHDQHFGHFDVLMGDEARKVVFPMVLDWLARPGTRSVVDVDVNIHGAGSASGQV
jgi:pimeloyl-ACP methyl ester carboxylesterase